MSTPAATIEDLLAAVRRLERKLDEALQPAPKLLSRRAAAKMLGVDRGTTLAALIHAGALRVVMGKIPLVDLERLLAEGVPAPKHRERARAAPADEAGAIRDTKL